MKCMFCGCLDSKVIDSRANDEGTSIRRRRECISCGKRFTTYENIETTPLMVVKASGARQAFSAAKLKSGIVKACEKRPVAMYVIDNLVEDIQKRLYSTLEQEVTTTQIGEMVMEGLKDIDGVAYVRFASVYRQFTDISAFVKELEKLKK
ncbi:MAG: transcriptional repressor NrdR [Clostridia bacterium]|nr:transcriptional repressor NrdR [Clostridia bacterium]